MTIALGPDGLPPDPETAAALARIAVAAVREAHRRDDMRAALAELVAFEAAPDYLETPDEQRARVERASAALERALGGAP